MEKEIPLQRIAQLFAEQGVVFVDDEQIPQALKARGWRSETAQAYAAGTYEVSHRIYAPEEGGAPACIFEQKMRIESLAHADGAGPGGEVLKAVHVYPGESSPQVEELLLHIEAAKKTLEFEVRF